MLLFLLLLLLLLLLRRMLVDFARVVFVKRAGDVFVLVLVLVFVLVLCGRVAVSCRVECLPARHDDCVVVGRVLR